MDDRQRILDHVQDEWHDGGGRAENGFATDGCDGAKHPVLDDAGRHARSPALEFDLMNVNQETISDPLNVELVGQLAKKKHRVARHISSSEVQHSLILWIDFIRELRLV